MIPEENRKNPKILVLGATGMLGSDIIAACTERFGSESIVAPTRSDLDITDEKKVYAYISATKPHWVFNAAAYTNVDKAESERRLASDLNAKAPGYLSLACEKVGARLIHFSTDQVFDGKKELPYDEGDTTNPLNYYAETKLEGENAALRQSRNLVIRLQWLYGKKKDRFTILRDKEVFRPFKDQFGSPTWTVHVAVVTLDLLEKNMTGLINFSYDDYASWSEVFQFVKETMGYRVKLEPIATREANLTAERPLYSVLSNEKLKQSLGRSMGSWRMALATFLSGVRR